jgi:hypothetical protein
MNQKHAKEPTPLDTKESIPFQSILHGYAKIFEPSSHDVLALVRLIDQDEYIQLRNKVNAVFQVGPCSEFEGTLGEETEFGDVTDIMQEILLERHPPQETSSSMMLNHSERLEWRDQTLSALDEMAVL